MRRQISFAIRTALATRVAGASALRWLTLATCALMNVTCESPTAPRGVGQRVAAGVTVSGRATPGDVQNYSFNVEQDGEYAVFLAAAAGTAQLGVLDSQHVQLLAQLSAGPTSGPLLSNATPDFPATKGTVLLITVGAQTAVGFDFQVYAVNAAPERRAAAFSIGDTIAGEDIVPVADVDNFWMQGQAGQEIVVVPQPLGPTGAGTLILSITDTLTHSEIGYAFNDPGNASPRTTARIRLHSSAAYRFQLRGVTGVNSGVAPRYQGPYRFWSYAINRAPEHRSSVLPVGAVVSGERIDRAGDVDEFTFQAAAGAQYNAFAQGSRQVQLEVAPDSGPALAAMLSDTADTGLYAVATGRFTIPQGGGYLVRVFGTASYDLADTGSYRVLLYPIDPRPEHVSATIQPGDTISGESIGVPGDIDEFPLPGAAGDEFNIFFQVLTGSPGVPLQLVAADSLGLAAGLVQSRAGDTSLTGQFTGRFALPSAGALRIRVTGIGTNTALDTGAYRFRVDRINRKPETLPDTLAFGDSLIGERIDLPGDVDEFHVSIPDSSGVNLVAEIDSNTTGQVLDVTLLDSAGHVVADLQPYTPGAFLQIGPLRPGPGQYTLRVQGLYSTSAFVGPYRIWLYRFGFGPELAPDTIAIGDTISSETLDPPGDVDQFSFYGQRGGHINIALQGLATPGTGEFTVHLDGTGYPVVGSPRLADSLGTYQSNRIDLSSDGWYRISITAASTPDPISETGPYRFAITRFSTAPEHVGSGVVPGDSVTGEAIDFHGDWDEFTLTGTPGQLLAIVTRPVSGPAIPDLMVFDSTTGDTLAGVALQGFDKATARFTLPPSGQLKIAVSAPTGPNDFLGAYRFLVVPVNPAPENVPATFALGDTVRGEAIYPATDVDEFTGVGTPGDTLEPWWRLTADVVPAGEPIVLEIVDPATGAVLLGNLLQLLSSPSFITPGSFVVPASGTFVVRVRAAYDGDVATAPYEFFVAPVP